MTTKTEALRLADELDCGDFDVLTNYAAADEMRRLSAEVDRLEAANSELLGALHEAVDRCSNAPGAGQYSTLAAIESMARAAIARVGEIK